MRTADLDGDGDSDVVSTSFTDNKVAWYANSGNGVFGPQQLISDTAEAPRALKCADIDNDGAIDVIIGAASGTYWYRNLGNGQFEASVAVSTAVDDVYSLDVADIDGDGDLDVLGNSDDDPDAYWSANDGTGDFSPIQTIQSGPATGSWRNLQAADFDNDGDDDLIIAPVNTSIIHWYPNEGDGTFGEPNEIDFWEPAHWSMYVADLEGDGDIDVLTGGIFTNLASFYPNNGSGVFEEQIQFPIDFISDYGYSVHAVDIDLDGHLDPIYGFPTGIFWFPNEVAGVFEFKNEVEAGTFANDLWATDLDGDGDADVLAINTDGVFWYENHVGEGCVDPAACNYDPEVWIDNGTCCDNCGCDIEGGDNYDSGVCLNDGSCTFTVLGTVFYDENENGIMDPTEYGLPNQTVEYVTEGLFLMTNDDGQFYVNASGSSEYVFAYNATLEFPYITTDGTLTFDATQGNWNSEVLFGVSDEAPIYDLEANVYSSGAGYPCDVFRTHSICFRNTGNVIMDGVVEFTFDTLFQDYEEISPIFFFIFISV
ncbi:MAG: VCBS repeat-containing protein, partial [Flavobacteriales bacterium]|nr:VCBS repeat-containing protein [Flavobacteriales bacterium]